MKVMDYKGHEIGYDGFSKRFSVEDRGFSNQTEAESYIEKLVQAKKADFKRIPAILQDYAGNKLGGITSIIDGKDAWFSSASGRTKSRLAYLFHATPENIAKLEKHQELKRRINAFSAEANAIKFDSMITAEDEAK